MMGDPITPPPAPSFIGAVIGSFLYYLWIGFAFAIGAMLAIHIFGGWIGGGVLQRK